MQSGENESELLLHSSVLIDEMRTRFLILLSLLLIISGNSLYRYYTGCSPQMSTLSQQSPTVTVKCVLVSTALVINYSERVHVFLGHPMDDGISKAGY